MRAHGYNTADFVYDNRCRDKVFSKPRVEWTVAEGRRWAAVVENQRLDAETGFEWRWERADRLGLITNLPQSALVYPSVDGQVVDDDLEFASSLVHPRQERPESATPILARPLSLRCVYCTYIHGRPLRFLRDTRGLIQGRSRCQGCCRHGATHVCEKGDHRPPEDIAIRLAQAVAVLCTQWHGKRFPLQAGFVLKCGRGWKHMLRYTDAMDGVSVLPGSASSARDSACNHPGQIALGFPFERFLSSCSCVLPEQAQTAAQNAFIANVLMMKEDLAARVSRAFAPQRLQQESDFASHVERVSSLCGELAPIRGQMKPLLERHQHSSPICAVVASVGPPRPTLSSTPDCNCQAPWHERSKWERWHPECDRDRQVKYQLPCATSPWQSMWDGRLQQYFWVAEVGETELTDDLRLLSESAGKQALEDHCSWVQARFACCFAEGSQSGVPGKVSSWRCLSEDREESKDTGDRRDGDIVALSSESESSYAKVGSESEDESSEEEEEAGEEQLEHTPEVSDESSGSDSTREEPWDVDDPEDYAY